MYAKAHLQEILQHFKINALDVKVEAMNEGHIHNSLKVLNKTAKNNDYLLQKINQSVFQNVEKLMVSIDLVTKHISEKIEDHPEKDIFTFRVIPTKAGALFYKDSQNSYWRLYSFLPETHSFQKIESPEIAFECGKILGQFINLLSDLPVEKVYTSIPNFHNLAMRWEAFKKALEENAHNRANLANAQIDFAFQKIEKLLNFHHYIEAGFVPKRVTHNDTKCNNVLFDKKNKAVALVDLDTVMSGSVLFDFGDAIRTGANTAEEDEKNLGKVTLNLNLFKSYTQGFLKTTQSILTQNEIAHLVSSTQFMTFLIGLRFLTDYLSGDIYYKTSYAAHNLTRVKVQWKLLEELEKNEKEMKKIVNALK